MRAQPQNAFPILVDRIDPLLLDLAGVWGVVGQTLDPASVSRKPVKPNISSKPKDARRILMNG
jgi:hypothetical protein